MNDEATLCDQIVFRWEIRNTTGNGGYGPAAYSCDADFAEWVYEQTRTLLRPSEAQRRTSIGLLGLQDGQAMLFRRRAASDAGRRPNSVCHALIGPAAELAPALGPALRRRPWSQSMIRPEVTGQVLDPVDLCVLREDARIQEPGLHRDLQGAQAEFSALVAAMLRHSGRRLLVLDQGQELPAEALVHGLTALFAPFAEPDWNYSTFETWDAEVYRVALVPAWPDAAYQAAGTVRIDPRAPIVDPSAKLGGRLAELYLRDPEQALSVAGRASEAALAAGRGAEPDAKALAACLPASDRAALGLGRTGGGSFRPADSRPAEDGPVRPRTSSRPVDKPDRPWENPDRELVGPQFEAGAYGGPQFDDGRNPNRSYQRRPHGDPLPVAPQYVDEQYGDDRYSNEQYGDDFSAGDRNAQDPEIPASGAKTRDDAVAWPAVPAPPSSWRPDLRWAEPRKAGIPERLKSYLRKVLPAAQDPVSAENPQIESQMKAGRLESQEVADYAATLGDEALLSLVRTVFPLTTIDCALDRIWVELPLRRTRDRVGLAVLACARIGRLGPVSADRRELDLALSETLFDIAVRPSLGQPDTSRAVGELFNRLWLDQAHGRDLLLRIIGHPGRLRLPTGVWRQLVLAMADEVRSAAPPPVDHPDPFDRPNPLTEGYRTAAPELSGPGFTTRFGSRTGPDSDRPASRLSLATSLALAALALVAVLLLRLIL